jgi:sialate O-acetylesterase
MRTALLIVALVAHIAHAQQLAFSPLCDSGAVLQQDDDVVIWGTAPPGERVHVAPAWHNMVVTTTDEKGAWSITVPTPAAGGPYTISAALDNAESITADDILIGEVWLCAGQSNMEHPIAPTPWTPHGTDNWQETLANADDDRLRIFTVARASSAEPRTDYAGRWQHADADSLRGFSAVAYHMGARLRHELDVPVGIVTSTWGGTRVQAWTSEEANRSVPSMADEMPAPDRLHQPNDPAALYNAMIHPITRLNVRGFAWYQGESNRADWRRYADCLTAMINDWRTRFTNADDAPFLIVQIAPFDYAEPNDHTMRLREAQREVGSRRNNGLVVTTDVGDARDIHPTNKKPVGQRLAGLALAYAYYERLCVDSPAPFRAVRHDTTVTLHFDNACDRLVTNDAQPPRGFQAVTAAGETTAVTPEIRGSLLVFRLDPDVTTIRYAWADVPDANLQNKVALPAVPFEIAIDD